MFVLILVSDMHLAISMSVLKIMFVLFIFFIARVHCATNRKCDPIDELQCDDGSCVTKFEWCDTKVNCKDGSDEMFCNGSKACRQGIHFECENKKCIPVSAVCDEFDDCYDGSDEKNCNSSVWLDDVSRLTSAPTSLYSSSLNFSSDMPTDVNVDKAAVDRAVEYLLSLRNSDNGWGTFTPRAVIALSMASSVSPMAKKNKQLILKQLNIQILQDLMHKRKNTLSSLALYINALHATCQDSRNFQGVDLVARLRSETDVAIKTNTSIPLAFLTLCLSSATRTDDNFKLADMYNSRELGMRTGSRALIMLAMACIMHKDQTGIFGDYMSHFFSEEINQARFADIYTQALFKQASIAAGFPYAYDLASKQLPDGSFGDLLSTYYAIPVLMNSSLLDLACKSPNERSVLENTDKTEGRNEVSYSLWITSGKNPITHSTNVKFYGKKSLLDIMMMAAARDPLYKFLYEESEQEGKMVYSVAGIPNDVESGTFWSLYIANTDDIKVNSAQGLTLLDMGVDKYFAQDKDHFIFWLRTSSTN